MAARYAGRAVRRSRQPRYTTIRDATVGAPRWLGQGRTSDHPGLAMNSSEAHGPYLIWTAICRPVGFPQARRLSGDSSTAASARRAPSSSELRGVAPARGWRSSAVRGSAFACGTYGAGEERRSSPVYRCQAPTGRRAKTVPHCRAAAVVASVGAMTPLAPRGGFCSCARAATDRRRSVSAVIRESHGGQPLPSAPPRGIACVGCSGSKFDWPSCTIEVPEDLAVPRGGSVPPSARA
jgi:hypothetical protein